MPLSTKENDVQVMINAVGYQGNATEGSKRREVRRSMFILTEFYLKKGPYKFHLIVHLGKHLAVFAITAGLYTVFLDVFTAQLLPIFPGLIAQGACLVLILY